MFRLIKMIKDKGRWRIFKLKLIDARLYFVSIFVGLLTGLVAVPYHYLLQFFFNLRHDFFDSRPKWYWYIPLFLLMWGILVFVSWLVKKMPLITGGGIPQTRGVINGRVDYKHPFLELVAKFVGGILALSTGLSLGREGKVHALHANVNDVDAQRLDARLQEFRNLRHRFFTFARSDLIHRAFIDGNIEHVALTIRS